MRDEDVFCPECDRVGTHSDECISRDNFPCSIKLTDDNIIISATTSYGNVMRNTDYDDPWTFTCPELPAFRNGRPIIHSTRNGCKWFRFAGESENTIMNLTTQNQPAASPRRHGNALASPRFASTPAPTQFSRQLASDSISRNRSVNFETNRRQQADLDLSTTVVESFRHSQVSMRMAECIPTFDGQSKNFDPWLQKVKQASAFIPDDELLAFVRMKLGPIPSQHVSSIGSAGDTLTGLLEALGLEYDDHGVAAVIAFQSMRQGSKTIASHHAEVTRILRAMRVPLNTLDDGLRTNYARSLSDERVSRRLTSLLIQKPDTTLEQMMKNSADSEKVDKVFSLMRDQPN